MRTELRMLEIWLASFVRAHAAWRKALGDADAGDADADDGHAAPPAGLVFRKKRQRQRRQQNEQLPPLLLWH